MRDNKKVINKNTDYILFNNQQNNNRNEENIRRIKMKIKRNQ